MTAQITLTYDGGLPSHREFVLPRLAERGLVATFFLDAASLVEHHPVWSSARERGHELGSGPFFGSALDTGELKGWTLAMVQSEIVESNEAFLELNGSVPESFGYPMGYAITGEHVSYEEAVRARFLWARSGQEGVNARSDFEPQRLKCFRVEGADPRPAEDYIAYAVQTHSWGILSFAHVGEGDPGCDLAVHDRLLDALLLPGSEVAVVTLSQGVRNLLELVLD